VDATVISANRALASRGFTAEEARVELVDDGETGLYRLLGSMLEGIEIGAPGHMLRLVTLIPERSVLVEARDQWRALGA
jgi:hypothetical protein